MDPKFTPTEIQKINDISSKIVKHKEFLISNVFLQWFNNISSSTTMNRPNLFIGTPNPSHEYSVFKIANGYLDYHPNRTGLVQEIVDPKLPSIDMTIDHLKTGYNNIIELWDNIKNDGNQLMHLVLDCLNDIEESLNQNMMDISFSQLQKYTDNENISTNYYLLGEIVKLIYQEISKKQENLINRSNIPLNDLEIKPDPRNNNFTLENAIIYVKSPNKNTINQFRNMLMELINDTNFNNRINEITKKKHEINNKIQELESGFNNIRLDQMQGLELGGECNNCKRIKHVDK